MNRESEDSDEMRAEYDIRGGVRGKYFLRYTQEPITTVVHTSAGQIIGSITSSKPADVTISMTRSLAIHTAPLSRRLAGNPSQDLVHAGENPPR